MFVSTGAELHTTGRHLFPRRLLPQHVGVICLWLRLRHDPNAFHTPVSSASSATEDQIARKCCVAMSIAKKSADKTVRLVHQERHKLRTSTRVLLCIFSSLGALRPRTEHLVRLSDGQQRHIHPAILLGEIVSQPPPSMSRAFSLASRTTCTVNRTVTASCTNAGRLRTSHLSPRSSTTTSFFIR